MTHPTSPPKVALHIGVHKTATTHLQRSMLAFDDQLVAQGVRYFGPDKLRGAGKSLIDRFGLKVEGARTKTMPIFTPLQERAQMLGDGTRMVLSDENFIGTLQTGAGEMSMPLYPRAPERIAALAAALDAGPIDVFVGVRNPSSFLVSAYSQLLMGGKARPFEQYLAKNPLRGIYWPGLIARLRALPAVGRLVVWRYEDYAMIYPQICAQLTGVGLPIRPLPEVSHRGLSEKAVHVALAEYARTGERGAGKAARDLHPISTTTPAFSPFDAQTHEQSLADYAAQINDLTALDGVTLLRP